MYVDDVLSVPETMRKCVRWYTGDKAFIWTIEAELEDAKRDPQEITMAVISAMASSVVDCLRFSWDYPAQNANKKMAVLNTAMWIGYSRRQ